MSTIIGSPLTRIGQELVLDPVEGYRTREVWRGTQAQLLGLQAAFNTGGLRSTVDVTEGRPQLYVDIAGQDPNGGDEVPVEKWTFNKDYVQESLWSNKRIMDLIESYRALLQSTYGKVFLFSDVLSGVRRDCENALKGLRPDAVYSVVEDGLPTGTSGVTYEEISKGPLTPAETLFANYISPIPLNIYKLLLLGADSYEIERLVVTRSRTFSIAYASRVQMLETPRIYSTASLIAAEFIPAVIAAQLPGTPSSKPENTAWAWKVRQDRSEISSNGKVEEVRDWVFAPWSTLLYQLV
jgi:hypothetical protein